MTAVNLNRAVRGPVTAVPVVAGNGVRFVEDVQNNRVVAELDETVLFEGNFSSGNVQLSEAFSNFERIRYYIANGVNSVVFVNEFVTGNSICMTATFSDDAGKFYTASMLTHCSNSTTLVYDGVRGFTATVSGTGQQTVNGLYGITVVGLNVSKIVGVNRIAGGN